MVSPALKAWRVGCLAMRAWNFSAISASTSQCTLVPDPDCTYRTSSAMCQCLAERLPAGMRCWYRSTLKQRTSVCAGEKIERMCPSRVSSQVVSEGDTTFLRWVTPGVHTCDQSSRGPKRSSSSTNGPGLPCCTNPKYIQVDFALNTRVCASPPLLAWPCTESVCTTTTSSLAQS